MEFGKKSAKIRELKAALRERDEVIAGHEPYMPLVRRAKDLVDAEMVDGTLDPAVYKATLDRLSDQERLERGQALWDHASHAVKLDFLAAAIPKEVFLDLIAKELPESGVSHQ